MLKTLSAVLLASLITITAAPAHADGEYDAVNTQQPDTSVRVLPERCTGPVNVMPDRARACRITRFKARPTVFVWGDSHSWQQTPALINQAVATRTNLVTFQMGACPPMDLSRTAYRSQCAQLGELALAKIERTSRRQRVTVVLGGAWALYADLVARVGDGWVPEGHDVFLARQAAMWKVGTPRAFAALEAMRRVRTVGIAQMPMQPSIAPTEEVPPTTPEAPEASEVAPPTHDECADQSAEDLTPTEPTGSTGPTGPTGAPAPRSVLRADAIPHEAQTAAWLARGVDRVVDATRYVCDTTRCFSSVADLPTWLDALHLNPAISSTFARAYAPVFRR